MEGLYVCCILGEIELSELRLTRTDRLVVDQILPPSDPFVVRIVLGRLFHVVIGIIHHVEPVLVDLGHRTLFVFVEVGQEL